jgi:hypothetical protein
MENDDESSGPGEPELRPGCEWADLFDIEVVDFGGWDLAHLEYSFYEEPISREEFLDRVARSVTRPLRGP